MLVWPQLSTVAALIPSAFRNRACALTGPKGFEESAFSVSAASWPPGIGGKFIFFFLSVSLLLATGTNIGLEYNTRHA